MARLIISLIILEFGFLIKPTSACNVQTARQRCATDIDFTIDSYTLPRIPVLAAQPPNVLILTKDKDP